MDGWDRDEWIVGNEGAWVSKRQAVQKTPSRTSQAQKVRWQTLPMSTAEHGVPPYGSEPILSDTSNPMPPGDAARQEDVRAVRRDSTSLIRDGFHARHTALEGDLPAQI